MSDKSSTIDQQKAELEAIRARAPDRKLRKVDVVRWAKANPKSVLHSKFQWDIKKAAWQHWLTQAGEIIRVHVTVITPETPETRVYVSLMPDRMVRGGGYRTIEEVLKDPQQRATLLQQAMREASAWRERYAALNELSKVFKALDDMEASA